MLCSSTVIILPHSFADFRISSLSRGLIVDMFMTLALIPCSLSSSAASSAIFTHIPVATIASESPSRRTSPFPISKLHPFSWRSSTAILPVLIYTGPLYSAAAFTAAAVSVASHGFITTMLGMLLMRDISSIA